MFYFNYEDFNVLGSSPEILVRLRGGEVTIRPIAGTRPRGKNNKEDKRYELDLLKDKKELAEHLMLLDLGRNDVGKVSKVNTVKVTEKFKVERYSHVMHIVSNVIGKFNNKFSFNLPLSLRLLLCLLFQHTLFQVYYQQRYQHQLVRKIFYF